MMSQDINTLITDTAQITPEWITHVLYHSSALTERHVIATNIVALPRWN